MVKSMNPDLLNPLEIKIGRLKSKLEEFKRYDKERREYYRDALFRLGELESLVDEADPELKLRNKIKAQKQTINSLKAALIVCNADPIEDIDLVKAKAKIIELTNELQKIKESLNKHKETISQLVTELLILKNKANEAD